jgi:cellulose synthase/poly-beta-1,6-N-acetylglucosamine synthase-like glycosyltransferase
VTDAVAIAAVGAVALFVALPSSYLAFLAAVTLLPKRAAPQAAPRGDFPVFAVLVPAHNEELAIGRTVANLARLRYPAGRFTVHVVADNCTDATAEIARSHGAVVHERNEPHRRGKGAALNWLMDELRGDGIAIDAFVVVDADTVLSADFLVAMSRHLRTGAEVVQGLNLVRVSEDRPLIRIRELAFELGCHLRPLAYERLGGSSGLYGNGMCLTAAICRRYRWNESSVVEDAELFLRLVRDGHRIQLASDAIVRSIMPATLREAGSQAVRWERGKFDYTRELAELLRRGVLRRDPNALVAGLSGFIPPLAPIALASVLALLAGAAAGITGVVILAAISAFCLLFYVLRGAALGRMSPRVILRIAFWAPSYCVWKLGVVTLAALGAGRGDWKSSRAIPGVERPLAVD